MASITQQEGAAAGTPASGYSTVYVKTDGLWYSKDDAGTEYQLSHLYSTGTFTPIFRGLTGNGTFTYAHQVGSYTRIGDLVFVQGSIEISAISVAPTGNMALGSLPFTSAAVTNQYFGIALGEIHQLDYPAGALQITAAVVPTVTYAQLYYSVDNGAAVPYPAASFTNTATRIRFSGFYKV